MVNPASHAPAVKAAAESGPARLWFEFTLVFVGLPTAYWLGLVPLPKIPFLLLIVAAVATALAFDPSFDRRTLWHAAPLRSELRRILLLFVVGATGVFAFTALAWPERLFEMPRNEPLQWLVLLVAYPLLSVYPQELLFRTFFYHRYAVLFPGPAVRIGANALAFGFMHVVYGNWIAVVCTTIGGVLFAWTYERTRSTLTASVEHALFGCWMFTVGLGAFFS
jgi:membrane protease YdiL (CAAX protease family)